MELTKLEDFFRLSSSIASDFEYMKKREEGLVIFKVLHLFSDSLCDNVSKFNIVSLIAVSISNCRLILLFYFVNSFGEIHL